MATPATAIALTVILALMLGAHYRVTAGPSFGYDAIYDLQNNQTKTHCYVTEEQPLSGEGCSTRGTLKLALASAAVDPQRRRVLIDLFFSDPTLYVFNLGDSSTNNVWGGDDGTQSRDAEIHGHNRNFMAYMSDYGGRTRNLIVNDLYSTRLTLLAGDGHILWMADNNNFFNYFHNDTFFALNGQPDTEGPINYDLYLGMNKVVKPYSDRHGSGLCKVGIKFLPEY